MYKNAVSKVKKYSKKESLISDMTKPEVVTREIGNVDRNLSTQIGLTNVDYSTTKIVHTTINDITLKSSTTIFRSPTNSMSNTKRRSQKQILNSVSRLLNFDTEFK